MYFLVKYLKLNLKYRILNNANQVFQLQLISYLVISFKV